MAVGPSKVPVGAATGSEIGAKAKRIGAFVMRYGLAVIFIWIGGMKFTTYEAQGIAPFVANSPLVSWWHGLLGIQGTSYMLGMIEITTGVLLALRPVSPRLSAIGAAMAVVTFLITLTFMFTTPGVAAAEAGGFPALSAQIGQFLAKDVGLLGISIWLLGDSLLAMGQGLTRSGADDQARGAMA